MTPRFRPKYVCAKADQKTIVNDSSLPANHSFSPERTRMEGSQLFSRSMKLSQKIGFVCGIFLILSPAWLFAQEPLRVGTIFSATQDRFGRHRKGASSRSMESRTWKSS